MTFDATDKKFQVSDEFPPDKESTWGYPKEKDGWTLAHNALRHEIRSLIVATEALNRRGSVKAWEVNSLSEAWKAHNEHIEAHHRNEDALFVPKVCCRPPRARGYPQKLGKLISELKEGSPADAVQKELVEYEKMICPHLEQEEDECLPLARAYFTPKEIGVKVQEILGKGSKIELGSFIFAMGAEAFRGEFMVQEGIPWFVWYIDFMWKLRLFRNRFMNHIEALKSGEEP